MKITNYGWSTKEQEKSPSVGDEVFEDTMAERIDTFADNMGRLYVSHDDSFK
ncbi:hypothetical protein [Streptomyces malaysiensis]|uniref:hypothetical protein n=1 Tax=Streptomyces malaysiensis TaxID=92644 RepID=UPI001F1C585E|nr:hypothetical protein [Streptomyces sp. SPMA113]